jgi:hypothetical protein
MIDPTLTAAMIAPARPVTALVTANVVTGSAV